VNIYSLGSPYGVVPCDHLAKFKGKHIPDQRAEFKGDPVVVWGQLRGAKELLAKSKNFYRMDHAYVGRLQYYRITKGDFQPSKIVERPSDRWDRLKKEYDLEMKPWKKSEGYILVALSEPATYSFFDETGWPERVEAELKKHTDRPIRLRKRRDDRPLSDDIRKAKCLVTFASNSVGEALLEGVPVFTLGPSIARPMGLNDLSKIEAPFYPENREEFFRHMSYCQFTNAEFASGFALKTADENEQQDTFEGCIDGNFNLRRTPDSSIKLAGSLGFDEQNPGVHLDCGKPGKSETPL
jgi:hypothetical protein